MKYEEVTTCIQQNVLSVYFPSPLDHYMDYNDHITTIFTMQTECRHGRVEHKNNKYRCNQYHKLKHKSRTEFEGRA